MMPPVKIPPMENCEDCEFADHYGNGYGDGDCSGDVSTSGIDGFNNDPCTYANGFGLAEDEVGQINGGGNNGLALGGSNDGDGGSDDAIFEVLEALVPLDLLNFFQPVDYKMLKYALAYSQAKTQEEKDSIIGMLELCREMQH